MFNEFQDKYDEYAENHEEKVVDEFEVNGSLVTLFTPVVLVKGLGSDMYAAEGLWSEKDDNGEYMPDWDLTWFWSVKEEPKNYIYFEQDPIGVATYNLSHAAKPELLGPLSMEIVEDYPTKE